MARNYHTSYRHSTFNSVLILLFVASQQQQWNVDATTVASVFMTGSQVKKHTQNMYSTNKPFTLANPANPPTKQPKLLKRSSTDALVHGRRLNPCSKGQYSSSLGCQTCQNGKYQNQLSHTDAECTDCPEGKNNFYENTDVAPASYEVCKACSNGKYFYDKVSACKICEPGKRNIFYDTSTIAVLVKVCENCPFGRIAPSTTSAVQHTECDQCEPGHEYVDAESECSGCADGQYQSRPKIDSKIFCKDNCYTPDGQVRCTDINICKRVCQRCSDGYHSINTFNDCQRCPKGKYQDVKIGQQPNVQECKICSAGQYASNTATKLCSLCSAGKFLLDDAAEVANHDDANKCMACNAGLFSEAGAMFCAPCSPGTAVPLDTTSQEGCVMCGLGRHMNISGHNMKDGPCIECPRGYHSAVEGSIDCTQCTRGKYQDNTTKPHCKKCPAGFYAGSVGLTRCLACGIGYYTTDDSSVGLTSIGAVQCERCHPGKYGNVSKHDGGGQCVTCALGYYNSGTDIAHMDGCIACTVGRFSSKEGQPSCADCPVGMYSDETASSQCTTCSQGTYNDETVSSKCKTCPKGWTTMIKGMYQCSECAIGLYGKAEGICSACAMNEYTDQLGEEECKTCKDGLESVETKYLISNRRATDDCTRPIEADAKVCSETDSTYDSYCTCLITARPGCINPVYEMAEDCLEREEYLYDCAEWDELLQRDTAVVANNSGPVCVNTGAETDQAQRLNRQCLQCEPGMICGKTSKLSTRTILRKSGWYYLDPTHKVLAIDFRNGADKDGDDHFYYQNSDRDGDDGKGDGILDSTHRKPSDVHFWKNADSASSDSAREKSMYKQDNFTALPCPIKSRCCGARVPVKVSSVEFPDGKWIVPDEDPFCSDWRDIFGAITKKLVHDQNGTFSQIQYPFWSITCAKGVNKNYPLCAKCEDSHESTGSKKRCEPCGKDTVYIRIAVGFGVVLLLAIFTLLLQVTGCSKKYCRLHRFRSAKGDVWRMVRLLVDFFQIVLSMEQIMPKVHWPSSFLEHVNGLVVFDLNFMDIFGMSCSFGVDFINSMYAYFAIPIIACFYLVLHLYFSAKTLRYQLVFAKNQGTLDEFWHGSLGEMFEFLLEPNKDASHDSEAPSHIVSEHGLSELLKISAHRSRMYTDHQKEAHKMIQRFSNNSGYLTKQEFCNAFNQIMDDRQSRSGSNNAAKEAIVNMKYNLVQWTRWQKIRSLVLERTFIILLVAHAPICKVAFRLFRCQEVGDRRYLMADYSVNCGTPPPYGSEHDVRYDVAWYLSIVMVSLYTIGFPVLLGYYLIRNRNVLYSFRVKMTVGWLYLHYNKNNEFWTLWEISLKVFLMGFLFFVPESQRPFAAAIASVLAVTVLTRAVPFKSPIVQSLATIKWFSTAMLYLSATQLITLSNGFEGSLIMITLMIIVDCCFVAGVVLIFYRLWVALQKNEGSPTVKLKSAAQRMLKMRRMSMLLTPPVKIVPLSADQKRLAEEKRAKEEAVKFEIANWVPEAKSSSDFESSVQPVEDAIGYVDNSEQSNYGGQEYHQPVAASTESAHHATPREIGGGWWESYDPASQRYFYANVDGKPTQWEWPEEIGRETRTLSSSIKFDTDRQTQHML
jgi:hypothetical protein